MAEVWALDDGYGDNKGVTGDGREILLSSYVTRLRKEYKRDLLEGADKNQLSYVIAEVDGKEYLVGDGATQDAKVNLIGGVNKHLDINFPILLKTCLGLMAKTVKTTVDTLVMGLPVNADEDENRHKQLRDLVVGTHKVKITLADGKTVNREIRVNDIEIKKQPLGSFFDVILDDAGNVQKRDIAVQYNTIVDVGARTLNIFTISDLEPINSLCDNTNDGIIASYEMLRDEIKGEFGRVVPLGQIRTLIQKGYIGDKSIEPLVEDCYEQLANRIKNILATMFADNDAMIDRFIFTGGGSNLLQEWLEDFEGYFRKEVIFLDRFATARGLRKYGVRHANKKNALTLTMQDIEGDANDETVSQDA